MTRVKAKFDLVRPDGVDPDAVARVFRVPPERAANRLDTFLQSQLKRTSRTRTQAIIAKSAFSPCGRPLRSSDRVQAEEMVVLWRPPDDEVVEPLELPVLFEDDHLLAIHKPPLVAVHPTARYQRSTILTRLQEARPDEPLTLIHRLDRETSGVLLLARTKPAERAFKRMIEDRTLADQGSTTGAAEIRKTYLAITRGAPDLGLIDLPLELDSDNSLRVKMRIATTERGLQAKTLVEAVETRGDYSMVRCRLLTGRQHQIRAHLSARGCPVVGDKLYGEDDRMLARAADGELTEEDLLKLELPRHALHAERYELPHAMTGESLRIEAPLAADLADFWNSRGDQPEPSAASAASIPES